MIRPSRLSLALLGASFLTLAGVAYPCATWLKQAETDALKAGELFGWAAQIETKTRELETARQRVESVKTASREVIRDIPLAADQAMLMRMLAVETGDSVQSQMISAGEPVPASLAAASPYKAVPVTVDMVATFPEVMRLLGRAEGGDRLVRTIKISIEKQSKRDNRREPDWDSPFVKAVIELDAVYGSAAGPAKEGTP